jgi:hypothetical protein
MSNSRRAGLAQADAALPIGGRNRWMVTGVGFDRLDRRLDSEQ